MLKVALKFLRGIVRLTPVERTDRHGVVNEVRSQLLGQTLEDSEANVHYWQNVYEHTDPGGTAAGTMAYFSVFRGLIKRTVNALLGPGCDDAEVDLLLEAHALHTRDTFRGYVLRVMASNSKESTASAVYEALLIGGTGTGERPGGHWLGETWMVAPGSGKATRDSAVLGLQVGAAWDKKERIFRRSGGLLAVGDSPKAVLWSAEYNASMIWWYPPAAGNRQDPPLPSAHGTSRPDSAVYEAVPVFPGFDGSDGDGRGTLDSAGEWEVTIERPASPETPNDGVLGRRGSVIARARFPVIPTRSEEGPSSDVFTESLVSRYWSVAAICADEAVGCSSSVTPCTKTSWSKGFGASSSRDE